MTTIYKQTKVGIAGLGAIGGAVARALIDGIEGYELHAASEINHDQAFDIPCVSFEGLAQSCDLIIETLPPEIVPELAEAVFKEEKDLILASSSALLLHPELLEKKGARKGRIIVSSGALSGLDGVSALAQTGIKSAKISTTKKPAGYEGAPHIIQNQIKLEEITEKEKLFSGNALEASKAFPANINVAATLSLAGIGPEKTEVEIWADPDIKGNTHEIKIIGEFSALTSKVENTPDPKNPKSSMLTAHSIISVLKKIENPLVVL